MSARDRIIAELARGGVIDSVRIVPMPRRWAIQDITGGIGEMEEAQVQDLVDARLIVGRPLDALWDHIEYRVTDQRAIVGAALRYWPKGFGWCPECDVIVSADAKDCAPRHGHTKEITGRPGTPPCPGTGKPLTHVIRPLGTSGEVRDVA